MYYKDDNHFVEATKVRSRVKSLAHEVFLDESVSEPEYYRNVVSLLRNQVAEADEVEMYISNGGGLAHTASVITDAMNNCSGKIRGYLSGQVCSAATCIALACDEWVVGDDICFMIHGASFGVYSDHSKVKDHHDFVQEWNKKKFIAEYTGFLTEDEIEKALEYGKEYWFNSEQVKERLQNFAEHRQKQQEAAIEDVISLQTEQSSEMEKVLHRQLVESKQFSQEEIDLAQRINEATFALDESLNDEEFNELMEKGIPPESLDDEPEKSLVLKRETVNGEVYEVSEEGTWYVCDDCCADYRVTKEKLVKYWDIDDLKDHCNDFGIKYESNVKNEHILIKKIIKDAEKFWEENAS